MPNTLFVVDDSATMRKVFELTFAGEDITVVTHDGSDGVVAKFREVRPHAAIVDVALANNAAGYDVVRGLRSEQGVGSIPIYLLYSEHSPLDEGSARSCGAAGAIVKPFETQVLIDKVKQALSTVGKGNLIGPTGNNTTPFGHPQAGPTPIATSTATAAKGTETAPFTSPRPAAPAAPPGVRVGAVRAPTPPAASAASTTPGGLGGAGARPPPPLPTPPPRPAAGGQNFQPDRPVTPKPAERPAASQIPIAEDEVQFEPAPLSKPAAPIADRPAVTVHTKPTSPALQPVTDALVQSVAHAVEQRTAGLGLTAAQVEAVTALTRDVVERVVWEVVPQLAEAMIREELKRLTAE